MLYRSPIVALCYQGNGPSQLANLGWIEEFEEKASAADGE
jgi:hypothetical protein